MPPFPSAALTAQPLRLDASRLRYTRFVLLVAGLGGLLYGVDVGIIGSALPYLQATWNLSAAQLSIIVAAVLLGSVISTLFAGLLADLFGRKPMMIVSGIAFSLSIPVIALSHTYGALFAGRLLQGISGGFVGVVVPLYLAECLPASTRGRGTAMFQWLLTFGILAAAVIGIYFSYHVKAVTAGADASALHAFKDHAWRSIFWVSLPPGLLFVLGACFVGESPRWLYQRNRIAAAETALLRSRMPEQTALEMEEMRSSASASSTLTSRARESLLRRRYVLPFVLACVILACNQATGINSIIGYNTNILLQSGLSDLAAHWGYVLFTAVNFGMTMIGVALVDRKGRKFLFTLGCAGLCVSLLAVGMLFRSTERHSADVTAQVQPMVTADQTLTLPFDPSTASRLLATQPSSGIDSARASLAVIYAYGDFTSATSIHRSDDEGATPIAIDRASALPGSKVEAFFQNPFANLSAAQSAPLRIVTAKITAVPDASHGWLVALALYVFMSFFAIGPGVCVWLALSELMPTRIRSNGMSVALLINQAVSTLIAGVFLPVVSKHGYSFMFFLFAACSIVYLVTVAFFLPETKGRTLEEIEQLFEKSAA
jgi:SP family myo-inositol transporter-like MFS transporter 13